MSANEITSGRFTSLPVTIDAWLIDSCNEPHPPWVQLAFLNDAIDWDPAGGGLYIETREGYMYGADGSWLIRGVKGELYACAADSFEATYEPTKEES